ncbi:MAG: hypothetical protein PHU08_01620 [Dehalococcoidales bacterium]|nr:hypothetical protein [Dehalococcoidales bacterium]
MNQTPGRNSFDVECYTHSQVVNGQISCPEGVRVLDFLNASATIDRNASAEFIELANASDGSTSDLLHEKRKEYVRKAAIHLVAVPDANTGRGVSTTGAKVYPFIHKDPARVTVQLQGYTLFGTIHRCQGQTTQDVLNESTRFLPLTDVTIAREYGICGTRPFVAVNKEQIISSREERLN